LAWFGSSFELFIALSFEGPIEIFNNGGPMDWDLGPSLWTIGSGLKMSFVYLQGPGQLDL
jgi:hypothetical protein